MTFWLYLFEISVKSNLLFSRTATISSFPTLSEILSVIHGNYTGSSIASIFPFFEESPFLFVPCQYVQYMSIEEVRITEKSR